MCLAFSCAVSSSVPALLTQFCDCPPGRLGQLPWTFHVCQARHVSDAASAGRAKRTSRPKQQSSYPPCQLWHAGMYVQQERYPYYYGKGITGKNFLKNRVIRSSPNWRTSSFEPSVSERTLIGSIDFPAAVRDIETRIYRGLITPSSDTEGVVLFRVTSDDASHMRLNGRMALEINGQHPPVTRTHGEKLSQGKPLHFEVCNSAHCSMRAASWTPICGPPPATINHWHVHV